MCVCARVRWVHESNSASVEKRLPGLCPLRPAPRCAFSLDGGGGFLFSKNSSTEMQFVYHSVHSVDMHDPLVFGHSQGCAMVSTSGFRPFPSPHKESQSPSVPRFPLS